MKKYSLKTEFVFWFALIVLAVILVISVASNILINRQFEQYVMQQQNNQAEEIADNLASQYDGETDAWNLDYVHGMGMYALNEGYVIKLYDKNGAMLWDAEHHDMTLCHDVMEAIQLRMKEERPELEGEFVARRFELLQSEELIGYLDISYYSPYYLNENAFRFLTALNRILIAVGLISLLGAVFMGLVLANYITVPISKTVEITKQISEGNYRIHFQEGIKSRELWELTQAVGQMAENLEQQENLRRRLSSDVAHELRTPIANISSYMEMMIEEMWEPTPERLKNCYDELQRISSLVSDLERLRQEENENLILKKTDVDLLEFARTVAGQFETQFADKHQTCTVEGEITVVPVDRDRMQQVMTNLISNAVKYTGEGGRIHILTENKPDAGVLKISDNGIGISGQDCKRIFERFYRADQSRNRKTGGAGIGLTIAKAIVQEHGGRIMADSELGKGSCFTVVIPK